MSAETTARLQALAGAAPERPQVEPLWTVAEVRAYLRVGRNQVYELARSGELPARWIGSNRVRFIPAEVRAWVENGGSNRKR